MSEQSPVTNREAVLASLLAHACVIILILLFPDALKWSGRSPFGAQDPNAPIPIAFLKEAPREEPPSALLGDSGKLKSSERRPADAPPPSNEDPYSAGNTRNRFVAPPMPERANPAPDPGPRGAEAFERPEDAARLRNGESDAGGSPAQETQTDTPAQTQFHLPPRGQRDGGQPGQEDRQGGSIREALGKMSLGMSGGAPLKFDNPTGGLSGPLGGLSFDTPGFDWGPYARKIYWVIWTNWTRGWPPAAWAGLKGIVTVHFTIWKDGRISGITILDPSGTPAFDTCATLALEASSPLPPLPIDFPKESEGITARFLYNTDAEDH